MSELSEQAIIINAPRFNKGYAKKGDLKELTVANKLTSRSLVDIKLGESALAFFVETTADQIVFMTIEGKQYVALQDAIDGNVIVQRMAVYLPCDKKAATVAKEVKYDGNNNPGVTV